MTSPDEPRAGLWARSRRQAHSEITSIAMDLFLEHGFEETTVDEIVAAAGISRRSFFRYFGTKEDVVLTHLVADGAVVREQLERQPDGQDVWAALRSTLFALEDPANHDRVLAIARMMYRTPSLRARTIEKHLRWSDELEPEVRRRLGGGPDAALRARAIVGCVVTCLDVAGEAWCDDGGTEPLQSYFDTALEAVRPSRSARTT